VPESLASSVYAGEGAYAVALRMQPLVLEEIRNEEILDLQYPI
jgi:hypothetical protein